MEFYVIFVLCFVFGMKLLAFVNTFPDWLVTPVSNWPSTRVYIDRTPISFCNKSLVITNGLISRYFSLCDSGLVTIDFYSHEKSSSLLRALSPEARIKLDDIEYNVGGIMTSISRAYLNRTALREDYPRPDMDSFRFTGKYKVIDPLPPFEYKRPRRFGSSNLHWPSKGKRLDLYFKTTRFAKHSHVIVVVHYEMYDHIPLLSKWISIMMIRPNSVNVQNIVPIKASIVSVEELHLNWPWSQDGYNWMYVISNQPHGTVIDWTFDQVAKSTLPGSFAPMLNASYINRFEVPLSIEPGFDIVVSFRVLELVIGSDERERRGLSIRRMTRLLAPQTTENPIFFHFTNGTSSVAFRKVIDQMAEVGFEMLIFSFGSGIDIENKSKAFLQRLRSDVKYANSKGIEVGCYDLIAWTRKVPKRWSVINETGQETNNACIASGWYDDLLNKLIKIHKFANITMLETDGPYPGFSCSSKNHKYHTDIRDSIYKQNYRQGLFYTELRKREIYINQPDLYFFQGANKAAMGYNEAQFSLPRWTDLSISRQGIFDDTFKNIPSQGWMFVPLIVYHGGGSKAAFEPLHNNLKEYEWALAQYLGAGIAACYRGFRIYDTAETKKVVLNWINFYKTNRNILTSDIIHVKRGDMQSIDCFLHVDANIYETTENNHPRGLAMLFNPTSEIQNVERFQLPLYYTGLTTRTRLVFRNETQLKMNIERDFSIHVPIFMNPYEINWIIIYQENGLDV